MKHICITGAEGFIGSHLTELLVRSGYKVKGYILYNSFNSWGWLDLLPPEILASVEVVCGDVRDPVRTKAALEGCHAVLHLAALIAIPYSYVAPSSYVETNVQGTLNVMQAATELGLEKVIHTSTSEVYGTAQFVPITEEHPLQGQSPYSASKIGADQIAMSYYYSFKTPLTILRPFNTYGPRQSNRAIIPTVITQIASGKRELELGSLTPTRDLNYVDDTVSAYLAALKLNTPTILGETINVGSQYEISIGALVNLIAKLMNVEVTIKQDPKRIRPESSEVERLLASNQKAQRLLEWEPRYGELSGLEQGLCKTIEWFTCDTNLKQYKSQLYNV